MSSGLFMKMHRMDSSRTLLGQLGWPYFYWGNVKNMAFCGCWTLYDAVLVQTILWYIPWWRHQMESFSALLALCAGNSPVTGEFPAQRPVTRSFDVFYDLCLNKRLSKQSRGWWRHHRAYYDVIVMGLERREDFSTHQTRVTKPSPQWWQYTPPISN